MQDSLIFISSLVFLAGVLMVTLSMFEGVRRRYPKVLLHGFFVALLSFALVFVASFLD